MSTQFRIGAVMILFSVSCLGCGSKEAEGVPPGVNLPAPPERDNGAKAGLALAVQPEIVKVTPGGTAKVLVTAERKGCECHRRLDEQRDSVATGEERRRRRQFAQREIHARQRDHGNGRRRQP